MSRKKGKRKKSKSKTIPKKERLEIYVPLLAQKQGVRAISRATGIPLSTVKLDLKNARSMAPPASANDSGNNLAVSCPAPKSDHWNDNLDDIGLVAAEVFRQTVTGKVACPTCNTEIPVARDMGEARQWAMTFSRLFTAKVGGTRIMIDARTQTINVTTIIQGCNDLDDKGAEEFINNLSDECPLWRLLVREAYTAAERLYKEKNR